MFGVRQLSPVWYNANCPQLMSRFDRYQLQLVYPTAEHRPMRNLQCGTSKTTFDRFPNPELHLHFWSKACLVVERCYVDTLLDSLC